MGKRKKSLSEGLTTEQSDVISKFIIRFRLFEDHEKMDILIELLDYLDIIWESIINYPEFTLQMKGYLNSYLNPSFKNEQPYNYVLIEMYRNKWFG